MTPEEIDHHVHVYRQVFKALLVLTAVTVIVAEFHLSIYRAILVALLIASLKGSLVAAYFMHLKWERKIVFATLALTAFFFLVLLLVPLATSPDMVIPPQYEP